MNIAHNPVTRMLAASGMIEDARQRGLKLPWPASRGHKPCQQIEVLAAEHQQRVSDELYFRHLDQAEELAREGSAEIETLATRLLAEALDADQAERRSVEAQRLAAYCNGLTPLQTLEQAEAAGTKLALDSKGRIVARNPAKLHPDTVAALRHHAVVVKELLRERQRVQVITE